MGTRESIFQHIVDKHVLKYDERFLEHGDDNKALGWPSRADNFQRLLTMFGLFDGRPHKEIRRVLDFGCGLGHFAKWLIERGISCAYTGLDINPAFVEFCQKKYPDLPFLNLDILQNGDFSLLPEFDYIIANGVFTEKLDTPWDEQWEYFRSITKRLWTRTRHGLAFNVMSPVVDEERDDLFHVPFDKMATFIKRDLPSRKFTLRHDYGLWEYTVYVYR